MRRGPVIPSFVLVPRLPRRGGARIPSMHASPKKPQLDALTSIRFFAAFHVVVYHSARALLDPEQTGGTFWVNLVRTGYTGVNLFYVLSGFILAYTYLEPGSPPSIARGRFWLARFARVYPIYLLSLLVVAPLVVEHFASSNPPGIAAAKIGVSGVGSLALLQAWVPQLRGIWNPPAWSLSAEAFFYLAFPFLAPLVWRCSRPRALAVAGGCWLAGLLPGVVSFWLTPSISAASAVEHLGPDTFATFLRGAPLLRLPAFLLGIALARAFLPVPGEPRSRPAMLASEAAVWGALGALALAIGAAHHIPRMLVHSGLLDPIYGALIVSLALSRGPLVWLLSWRALLVLGEASYAIYVFHVPLYKWGAVFFGDAHLEALGVRFFVVYVLLLIAFSVLTFYFVEDPSRHWIRRRFGRGGTASYRPGGPVEPAPRPGGPA